jgi:hypothetical protein
MAKYRVCGVVAGSKYLGEVEAATEEEAKEKGLKRAYVSLCHQCSGECSDPEIQEVNVELIETDEAPDARS